MCSQREDSLRSNSKNFIIGLGVYRELNINLNSIYEPIEVWYPNVDKMLSILPERAMIKRYFFPTDVATIDIDFDISKAIVPIEFIEDLLGYKNKRTSIEVKAKKREQIQIIKNNLSSLLKEDFIVQKSDEQQEDVLRAVKTERLFMTMIFTFILLLSSFNIFFSVVLMAIEKKRDMKILFSIGATRKLVQNIFLWQGVLIISNGIWKGLLFAAIVCFLQQEFSFLTFSMQENIINAYPVRLKIIDFIYTISITISITLIACFLASRQVSRKITNLQLK